jgi:hypothetical protein
LETGDATLHKEKNTPSERDGSEGVLLARAYENRRDKFELAVLSRVLNGFTVQVTAR